MPANRLKRIENNMKYNPKTIVLEFSTDAEVYKFHEELTELMRSAMSRLGDENTRDEEALKLTQDFFAHYATLADTLSSLRAHLKRADNR